MNRQLLFALIPLFLILGNSQISNAFCSCNSTLLWEQYKRAAFVGLVEVKKLYPNSPGEYFYHADLEVAEVFKGEALPSVRIYGSNAAPFQTSCDIFIPEGTRLIIYAQSDNKDEYAITFCSRYLLIDELDPAEVDREVSILNVLKEEGQKLYNEQFELSPIGLNQGLDALTEKRATSQFGIFAIYLDSILNTTGLEVISSFNKGIDKKIARILKKEVLWKYEPIDPDAPIPSNARYILILYHHQADRKSKSFFYPAYDY